MKNHSWEAMSKGFPLGKEFASAFDISCAPHFQQVIRKAIMALGAIPPFYSSYKTDIPRLCKHTSLMMILRRF